MRKIVILILAVIVYIGLLNLLYDTLNDKTEMEMVQPLQSPSEETIVVPVSNQVSPQSSSENTAQTVSAQDTKSTTSEYSDTPAKLNYTSFEGVWGPENSADLEGIKTIGGITITITSVKDNEVTGSIQAYQKPPESKIAETDFAGNISNEGVLSFNFSNDGFNNAGNGIIVFNEGQIKLSISTNVDTAAAPSWNLGNGMFILKKIQ